MDACKIPSNSDIAGLGIRAATYIQACATFIVTLLAITYRSMEMLSRPTTEDSDDQAHILLSFAPRLPRIDILSLVSEFKSTLVGLRNGLFVASISVLISALVLAFSKEGLTVYHGLVTLNLAQLNSLSSLMIWVVISYTHQPPDSLNFFTTMINISNTADSESVADTDSIASAMRRIAAPLKADVRNVFKPLSREAGHFVVHASLAGGFGLWFWSDQSRFERYAGESECVVQTMYWFFIPLHSHNKHIRRFFLAYNSLLVFPLTAPIAPTLLGLLATMAPVILLILLRIWIALAPLPSPTIVARFIIVVVASTIGVYVLPMVFYIYSTEQIIRLNVLEDEDEGNWSYGQTLALITALMSVVMLGSDIVKLARILRNRPDNVESAETRAESGVLGKPQGIGPSSSAVSLRDVEVTVRRTGTNATSL